MYTEQRFQIGFRNNIKFPFCSGSCCTKTENRCFISTVFKYFVVKINLVSSTPQQNKIPLISLNLVIYRVKIDQKVETSSEFLDSNLKLSCLQVSGPMHYLSAVFKFFISIQVSDQTRRKFKYPENTSPENS